MQNNTKPNVPPNFTVVSKVDETLQFEMDFLVRDQLGEELTEAYSIVLF
jgi:hypothetical protein